MGTSVTADDLRRLSKKNPIKIREATPEEIAQRDSGLPVGARMATPEEVAQYRPAPVAAPEPELPWYAPVTEPAKALALGTVKAAQTIGGAGVEMVGAGLAGLSDMDRRYQAGIKNEPDAAQQIQNIEQTPASNPFEGQIEMSRRTYAPAVNAPSIQPNPDMANATYLGDAPMFTKATKALSDAAGSFPSIGLATTAFMAGGPLAAGATGGMLEAANKYDEAKKQGLSDSEALAGAAVTGVGTSLLNALPFTEKIVKFIPAAARNRASNFVLRGIAEAGTETAEGVIHPFAEIAQGQRKVESYDDMKTLLVDAWDKAVEESSVAPGAFLAGGGMSLATNPNTQEDIAKAKAAKDKAEADAILKEMYLSEIDQEVQSGDGPTEEAYMAWLDEIRQAKFRKQQESAPERMATGERIAQEAVAQRNAAVENVSTAVGPRPIKADPIQAPLPQSTPVDPGVGVVPESPGTTGQIPAPPGTMPVAPTQRPTTPMPRKPMAVSPIAGVNAPTVQPFVGQRPIETPADRMTMPVTPSPLSVERIKTRLQEVMPASEAQRMVDDLATELGLSLPEAPQASTQPATPPPEPVAPQTTPQATDTTPSETIAPQPPTAFSASIPVKSAAQKRLASLLPADVATLDGAGNLAFDPSLDGVNNLSDAIYSAVESSGATPSQVKTLTKHANDMVREIEQAFSDASAKQEPTPEAEFLDWQERPRGQAPIALYNIPTPDGGKTTVTAETAKSQGFSVPEPPAQPATQPQEPVQAQSPVRAKPVTANWKGEGEGGQTGDRYIDRMLINQIPTYPKDMISIEDIGNGLSLVSPTGKGLGEFYIAKNESIKPAFSGGGRISIDRPVAVLKTSRKGVEHIAVLPEFQRRGLSQILLGKAKDLGRDVSSAEMATEAGAAAINKFNASQEQPTPPVRATEIAPEPEVAQKQPWEMTRSEVRDQRIGGGQEVFRRWTTTTGRSGKSMRDKNDMADWMRKEEQRVYSDHEAAVDQALASGKPVPPEVLADYPDLAQATQPAPEAKPEAPKAEVIDDTPVKGNTFYFKGDKARYTGETSEKYGSTWYEFEYLEGTNKGKNGVRLAPDDPSASRDENNKPTGRPTPQVPPPSKAPAAKPAAPSAYSPETQAIIDIYGDKAKALATLRKQSATAAKNKETNPATEKAIKELTEGPAPQQDDLFGAEEIQASQADAKQAQIPGGVEVIGKNVPAEYVTIPGNDALSDFRADIQRLGVKPGGRFTAEDLGYAGKNKPPWIRASGRYTADQWVEQAAAAGIVDAKDAGDSTALQRLMRGKQNERIPVAPARVEVPGATGKAPDTGKPSSVGDTMKGMGLTKDPMADVMARYEAGEITKAQAEAQRKRIVKQQRAEKKAGRKANPESGFLNIGAIAEGVKGLGQTLIGDKPFIEFTKGLREAKDLNVRRIGDTARVIREGEQALFDLTKAWREATGEGKGLVGKASAAVSSLPEEIRLQLNDFLSEKDPFAKRKALMALPETMREPAVRMRETADLLAKRMREEGVVVGQTAEIVEENEGSYLRRTYKIFKDKDYKAKIPKKTKLLMRKWIEQQNPDLLKQPNGQQEIDKILNGYLNVADSTEPTIVHRGRKLGSKDLSTLTRRNEFPKELLDLWGVEKDGVANYLETISAPAHLLANHKFYNSVAKAGEGRYIFSKKFQDNYVAGTNPEYERMLEENKLVPWEEDSSKKQNVRPDSEIGKYGAMAGSLVTPEFKKAMQEAVEIEELGWAMATLSTLNSYFKMGKTIFSPTTQALNFISNSAISLGAGHLTMGSPTAILGRMRQAIGMASTELTSRHNPKWRELGNRAIQLMVMGDTDTASELKKIRDESGRNVINKGAREIAKGIDPIFERAIDGLGRMRDVAIKLYQGGDDVWKAFAWLSETEHLRKAHPEWSQTKAEEQAALRVRRMYPTYTELSKTMQKIRRFPVAGPFIPFVAEIPRNTFNTMMQAQLDLRQGAKTGNSEQLAMGMRRAIGITAALSAPYAASLLGKLALDMDDEDDEAARRGLASWDKNSSIQWKSIDRENGVLKGENSSRTNPYGVVIDPVAAFLQADGPGSGILAALEEIADPYIAEELAFKSIRQQLQNLDEYNNPIVLESDPTGEEIVKRLEAIWKIAEPGALRSARNIMNAKEPAKRALQEATGQRLVNVDLKKSLSVKAAVFQRKASEPLKDVRAALKAEDPVAVKEQYGQYLAAHRLGFDELHELAAGMEYIGVSKRDIKKTLDEAGVGEEQQNRIIKGKYKEPNMPPAVKKSLRSL